MMESARRRFSPVLVTAALLLVACAPLAPACESPAAVRVFEAAEIGEQWIDYVWLELPVQGLFEEGSSTASAASRATGPTPTPVCPSCERPARLSTLVPSSPDAASGRGRMFVASADPVGAIVPTMLDLPCAESPVDYAPVPVDLELGTGGTFTTSYAWKSCAACSECYMHWTFSLDVKGRVQPDGLHAELLLNETFHSGPMKLVALEMKEVEQACTQPHIQCEPSGACNDIRFEGR